MLHSNNLCYQFGPFLFHVGLRLLTRAGAVISLGDKAAEVLLFLLRNAGHLVGKEDLMQEVWPDSFVEESNLTQNIFTLRRVLGDDRISSRYIETVPRRGYRFVAEVKQVESEAATLTEDTAKSGEGLMGPPPILGVLPFVNATGSEGYEYLADGISDNIINNLSRISKLRVMSRSSMFRYKSISLEPKRIASEMKLDALLVGKIVSPPSGMTISVELVDGNGFMLWGDSFDCELKDILEIQDEIARQISSALRLKLTGEEEKTITTRYTESSDAYQAYMEGRFHWSRYTKVEIEKAIEHFREAIELDPNYALAYAGIVDCYLRLATNYLPPENYLRTARAALDMVEAKLNTDKNGLEEPMGFSSNKPDRKVELRHEWDWKGAERESRRANELRTNYPAAHQWHAAYLMSRRLCLAAMPEAVPYPSNPQRKHLTARIPSINLTVSEDVQVSCTVAREQIDAGNYDAACVVLSRWWSLGDIPKLVGLPSESCADLLFTAGELAGFVASTKQIPMGQKSGEMLLSGAITFFEQLGSSIRSAESRIELAQCYYRQGNFDLARTVLIRVLDDLPSEENELRSLVLIRLACVERHSGRLLAGLARLEEAKDFVEASGPWATGRRHLELGSLYKDLAIAQDDDSFFDRALTHHHLALYEFEAVGNLRLMAIVENNLGLLKVCSHQLKDAVSHLENAWSLFDQLGDRVRRAQVDDTIARLHLEEGRFSLAEEAANRAVTMLEGGDEDALLAEALTTRAVVYAKLRRYAEAKRLFELAHAVALRCGDREGSGRALLIMIEEMCTHLTNEERNESAERCGSLLQNSQQPSIQRRVARALKLIERLR